MKYITLSIFLLLATVICIQAQNLSSEFEVIANAGEYSSSLNGNLSLSWTLGEPVVETIYGNKLILTQGFQQPDELTLGVSGVSLTELGLNVFPNPATLLACFPSTLEWERRPPEILQASTGERAITR